MPYEVILVENCVLGCRPIKPCRIISGNTLDLMSTGGEAQYRDLPGSLCALDQEATRDVNGVLLQGVIGALRSGSLRVNCQLLLRYLFVRRNHLLDHVVGSPEPHILKITDPDDVRWNIRLAALHPWSMPLVAAGHSTGVSSVPVAPPIRA